MAKIPEYRTLSPDALDALECCRARLFADHFAEQAAEQAAIFVKLRLRLLVAGEGGFKAHQPGLKLR